MLDYTLVGKRIREIRTQQCLSQLELAERAGLSAPYVSHVEQGKKKVNLEALVDIANALGTTVNDFLNGNQPFDPFAYHSDIDLLLSDCSSQEKRILYEAASALKQALQKKSGKAHGFSRVDESAIQSSPV